MYCLVIEPSLCLFEQLTISALARGGLKVLKKSKGKRKGSEDYNGKNELLRSPFVLFPGFPFISPTVIIVILGCQLA